MDQRTKYVFVTGGVVSSLGKGITTSSVGALLRARGYRVTAVKIDPYINVDAGTMRPYEHGEVFVTDDGAETDLDIGTYERFLDVDLGRGNNITTGQVYQAVIQKERQGAYLSQTVQVIPHVTDEIKARIYEAGEAAHAEIVLVEVGGTVGDIESLPFLEAIRQMRFEVGRDRSVYLHVTLLPYLGSSEEYKTKPTQHSVAALRGYGIQPDGLVVRSKTPVPDEARRKIALFTNVESDAVFSAYDADHVYAVPEMLEQQGLPRLFERHLGLERVTPELRVWQDAVRVLRQPEERVSIGVVGKYVAMPDAYLSLMEALKHAGIANRAQVDIDWVSAEAVADGDVEQLGGVRRRARAGRLRGARDRREGPRRALRTRAPRALPGHLPRDAGGRDRVRAHARGPGGGELDRVRSVHAAPGGRPHARAARGGGHGGHHAPRLLAHGRAAGHAPRRRLRGPAGAWRRRRGRRRRHEPGRHGARAPPPSLRGQPALRRGAARRGARRLGGHAGHAGTRRGLGRGRSSCATTRTSSPCNRTPSSPRA